MQKRFFHQSTLLALIFIIAHLVSCGGGSGSASSFNSNTPPPAATGSVALFGSDAPICDVVSFQVTITGAALTPEDGGTSATPAT
jgi:hypothetical protein